MTDLKMIDFAHTCTTEELMREEGDEEEWEGMRQEIEALPEKGKPVPDLGYLCGLDSLASMLQEILHEG